MKTTVSVQMAKLFYHGVLCLATSSEQEGGYVDLVYIGKPANQGRAVGAGSRAASSQRWDIPHKGIKTRRPCAFYSAA